MPTRSAPLRKEEFPPPFVTKAAENAEILAKLAGALAHPIRVQLLVWLMDRPDSIHMEMAKAFGHSQSIVRQHLKMMRESGIIHGVIHGNQLRYSINTEALAEFKVMVAGLGKMESALPARHHNY